MQIFVSGTDTNIGKTVVCSWLCLHTGATYFKPISTDATSGGDAAQVQLLSDATIHKTTFSYKTPVSPHLAAQLEGQEIDIKHITLPQSTNLIVEGAGGLMVPLNGKHLMIDLVRHLNLPVIIVASSRLGTINHTLLSLEALKSRKINILGVIMVGKDSLSNQAAIELYGNVQVLAILPWLYTLNKNNLQKIPMDTSLRYMLLQ